MDKLRIAHITATFPPYMAGTGNVCYYNARELARRGHDVHVFTARTGNTQKEETMDGFTVHRLRPWFRIGNAPFLPGLLSSIRGFDIVHFHYPFFGGELGILGAWLSGSKIFITYHQDVILTGALGLISWIHRHTIGRMVLHGADRVLFTSLDYGRSSHVRPFFEFRQKSFGELSNGVDTDHFSPAKSASPHKHFPDASFIALVVGGLDKAHRFKGIDIFLQVLSRLTENICGIVIGDGDLRETYLKLSEEFGLDGRVVFPGRISDEQLPGFYRLADVTVLPSTTMGEAFGLVLAESLACATPVIASDLPGVRTVVSDGVDGFLVSPGDPAALGEAVIKMKALSEEQRRKMGSAGRRKVEERYAWPKIGDRLGAIYQGFISAEADSAVHEAAL